MPTLNQIEASRRNGAKSKGPVTPEGKARVAQNGTTHGIYAQTVVLANEDPDLYSTWRHNHLAEWDPATDTEHNLVIDIVDARWRLRRLSILETKALDFEISRMRHEVDEAFGGGRADHALDEGTRTVLGLNSLLSLNRTWEVIQTSIRSQHRIIDRSTAQLLRLGKVRRRLDSEDNGPTPPASDTQTAAAGAIDASRRTPDEAPPHDASGTAPAEPRMDSVPDNGSTQAEGQQTTEPHGPRPSESTSAQPAGQPTSTAVAGHPNSEDQTRDSTAAHRNSDTCCEPNRSGDSEPDQFDTPHRPRVIFDPTFDASSEPRSTRLRAA